jgi:aryl-alcohol dehydrogenase-like predicted oxidoreductase
VDAAFGLGTASPGRLFSPVSDADAEATIERAWSLGVRFFDTAPLYGFGLAERRLGSFLRRQKRDSFAISTRRSLLASVNPAFAWVRLAQRIPVRIALDEIPDHISMVASRSSS